MSSQEGDAMVSMGLEECSNVAASVSVTAQKHIDRYSPLQKEKSVSVTLTHHAIDALSC